MASACKSVAGCADSHTPDRSSYVRIRKWAQSDAEFVLSVSRSAASGSPSRRIPWSNPEMVDSYSCRQMYLRSYTFSRKETVPEKTVKCLGKVRRSAAVLPCIVHPEEDDRSAGCCTKRRSGKDCSKRRNTSSKEKKSCFLFYLIFHRLISCAASVKVAHTLAGGDGGDGGDGSDGGDGGDGGRRFVNVSSFI